MFGRKAKKESLGRKAVNYAKRHPTQVVSAVTAAATGVVGYLEKRKAKRK